MSSSSVSNLLKDSPASPTRVLRRTTLEAVPEQVIDLSDNTSSPEEPPEKRPRTSQELPFSSPRKSVTVTVKANEVEEFRVPSASSSISSAIIGIKVPEGTSVTEKVLAIIDFLRERRRRPDENVITNCAERELNLPVRETLNVLNKLVEENRIVKVKYSSGYSYRYPSTRTSTGRLVPTTAVAVTGAAAAPSATTGVSNAAPRTRSKDPKKTKKTNHSGIATSSNGAPSGPVFRESQLNAVKSFAKLIAPTGGIVKPLKMSVNGNAPVSEKLRSALTQNGFMSNTNASNPPASRYDIPPTAPVTFEMVEKIFKSLPHRNETKADKVDAAAAAAAAAPPPPQQNGRSRPKRNSTTHPPSVIVRTHTDEGFVQLLFRSVGSTLHNTFTLQVLNELTEALRGFESDPQIRTILISGGGSVFSSGADLHSLCSKSEEDFADMYVKALRAFLLTLANYPKILVAGVNGHAEGLGVAVLPLFDLAYASDTASFHTAYSTLAQVPEAGASYTLGHKLGSPMANDLIFAGRRLSAREAQECGLISDVLFPKNFDQEILLRCARIATQSSSALEKSKCLTRLWDRERIEFQINVECNELAAIWKSAEFRVSAANYVRNRMDLFI